MLDQYQFTTALEDGGLQAASDINGGWGQYFVVKEGSIK